MNPTFFLHLLSSSGGSLDILVLIIDTSAKGVLAENEDQIAGLGIGLKVLAHGMFPFDTLSA